MTTPEQRYQGIAERIEAATLAAGRTVAPALIAVSKKQDPAAVEALYRLGHRDFGENYVQELLEKARALEEKGCPGIRWHFIGHLQTNKVRALLSVVHSIHSVDSEKLGREIAKRRQELAPDRPLGIFIEVNIDREASKAGVAPEEAPALASALGCLPELRIQGLMCVPASGARDAAEPFRRIRELELRCRPATHGSLSMGMTGDFEAAIREGATHIRIGTALFGAR